MASLDRSYGGASPRHSHRLRRRWVVTRLHLSRMAGIGMGSETVHDLLGFWVRLLSVVLGGLARVGRAVFLPLYRTLARTAYGVERLFQKALSGLWQLRLRALRRPAHVRGRLIPALMLAAATVGILTVCFLSVGLRVEINGVPVGIVSDRAEMEEILSSVQDRVSQYVGAPYSLDVDVSYSIAYDDGRGVDREQISDYLMAGLGDLAVKYVLTVDGQPIGANRSRTALELLRQRLLEKNATSFKGGKVDFVQDVQVVPQGSMDAREMSVADIESRLTGETRSAVIYEVQPGDTLSGIAARYGTTTADVMANNPGVQAENLLVGTHVVVQASVPVLSVKETVSEQYVQRIDYDTVRQENDEMYTTQSRVIKSGVYGEASVTADVTYVDGREDSRVVTDWVVTKEPESEIIEVGTQTPPPKSATGTFMKPSNGVYSSGFGYRKNLRDYHTGVDFAGPVGTSIFAADGGKVSYAAWKGNYGYCVFIDHENGYVTVYAHCSKLLVKEGQRVAKGETIARVGATGRVTGPHVHFEIRVNGTQVNPLKYIGK